MYRPNDIFYGDKSFFTGPDYMRKMVAKNGRKMPFIFSVSGELERMKERNSFNDKATGNQVRLTGTDGIAKSNLWKSLIHKHKDKIIKDKEQSWGRRILQHFNKFCANTALHGLHYLAEEDRLFVEKLWWIVTLIFVYFGCFLLIKDAVTNFIHSPTEITIENMPTPVGLLPFPAITICGSNQIKPTVFNFSAYFSMTPEEKAGLNRTYLQKLDYTDLLCRLGSLEVAGQDKIDISIFHWMLDHAHTTCEETFAVVKWNNYTLEKPCEYMQPILTDLGLCYSFNLLPFKILMSKNYLEVVNLHSKLNSWSKISKIKWTPEFGYHGEPQKAFDVPFRTAGTGSLHALSMHLSTSSEHYTQQCNLGSRGYTILLSSPTQLPSSSNVKLGVGGSSYHWVTVLPRKLRTSKDVGLWAPEKRGCYYYNERELLFFRIYTQVNCDIECESNYSLKVCGCVAYYHPRTLFTPVCGSNKMDCIEDSLTRFAEIYTENQGGCGCLPTCTQFDYESDVMSMDVAARLGNKKKRNNYSAKNKGKENSTSEYSIVSFTYQNRDTLGFVRDAKYGITDFLGNLGGIAGLFLGFSWISIFEITYFAFLRPLANVRLRYLTRVEQY